jgi:hypothetical protein
MKSIQNIQPTSQHNYHISPTHAKGTHHQSGLLNKPYESEMFTRSSLVDVNNDLVSYKCIRIIRGIALLKCMNESIVTKLS